MRPPILQAATNDDRGEFANVAAQLRLGRAELEPLHDRPLEMLWPRRGDTVVLGGRGWRISGAIHWHGGIAWTGFELEPRAGEVPLDPLADLVVLLHTQGVWRCTVAPREFYDWFNGPVTALPRATLRAMLTDLLED